MEIVLRRWLPGVAAIALLIAIWAHALLDFGGAGTADFFARWIHDAVFVVAALACAAHAVAGAPGPLPAAALGLGLLLVAVGTIYSLAPDLNAVPVPSWSDPFWLAIYPCEYIALLYLIRERVGPTLVAMRLTAWRAGSRSPSLMACFSMSTAIDSTAGAPFSEQLTNLAYPTADLVLLGAIVSAVALAGWRINRFGRCSAARSSRRRRRISSTCSAPREGIGVVADALVATGVIGMASAVITRSRPDARPVSGTGRGLFVPRRLRRDRTGVLALAVPLHINGVAISLAVATSASCSFGCCLPSRRTRRSLGTSRVEATTDSLHRVGQSAQARLTSRSPWRTARRALRTPW